MITLLIFQVENISIFLQKNKKQKNKESLKSTKRAINPEWPKNYYDAILEEEKSGKHDIILIAPCMPFEEMRNYGIDFILAYSTPDCKEEFKKRAKNRGANDEFIKRVDTKIEPDFEEFMRQPNEKKIIQPVEYLEDALIRVGIL